MKFYKFIFLLQIIALIICEPFCNDFSNFCRYCDILTNLCLKCENPEILIPDEKGGCKGAKKCYSGKNYCIECDS